MGLNKTVLRTRTITAVLYVAVMLLGLLTGKIAFISLCAVIAAGSVFELWRLAKKQTQYSVLALGILGTLFLLISIFHYLTTGFPSQKNGG